MFTQEYIVLLVLFIVVSLPQTYTLVNKCLSQVGLSGIVKSAGNVTVTGVVIHSVVFLALYCLYKKYNGGLVQSATFGLLSEDPEEFY